MNAPVVVWQRGKFRIVAVEVTTCEEHLTVEPLLLLEECVADALGDDCWLNIDFDDGATTAANLLLLEVAAKNEVMSAWVREFIEEQLGEYDEDAVEKREGDAS